MKKVISMNLINVIQMKTQSFWLTADLYSGPLSPNHP